MILCWVFYFVLAITKTNMKIKTKNWIVSWGVGGR